MIILVTGSSRGIGKAIVQKFADNGHRVIVHYNKSEKEARDVFDNLSKVNEQRHLIVQADIANIDDIDRMMDEIRETYGQLDVIVNNAGTTKFLDDKNLNELTPEIFDSIYKTNLRGAFYCVQKGIDLLKKSDNPNIVNISSIAAESAIGSNLAYCCFKAAMVNMTKSLARSLAPGIRVNAVGPGLTETDLMKNWVDYKKEQTGKTPLGRLGTPMDVAQAVYSIVFDLTYTTGQHIIVDGGRLLN